MNDRKPIMSVLVTVYDQGTCSVFCQSLEGESNGSRRSVALNDLPSEIRKHLQMSGLIEWPTPDEEQQENDK